MNLYGSQLETLNTIFLRDSLSARSINRINDDTHFSIIDDFTEQTIELVGCKRVVDFSHMRYGSKESRWLHIIIEKDGEQ